MGTLTLFSQESVSTGAITPVFQDVLLKSMDTVLLETAPGHQSRCALTPFAEEFLDERRKGLEAGWDGKTLARHLDGLILGRLRLATKGLRREGDQLQKVPADEQYRQGMYMVGEVAALQRSVAPLRQLFENLLPHEPQNQARTDTSTSQILPEPIAITPPLALPGATSLAAYCRSSTVSDRVVPDDRWADRYYSQADLQPRWSWWGSFIEPTVMVGSYP